MTSPPLGVFLSETPRTMQHHRHQRQHSTGYVLLTNVDRITDRLSYLNNSTLFPTEMKHIGNAIKEVFDRQPRGCTVSWFARQINCHRANVYDIFSRPTIDCELLGRICTVLNHNFFLDLASDMDHVLEQERQQIWPEE